MLEINKNPSKKELAWFGLALISFFGILGGMILWRTGSLDVPRVLWTIGATVGVLYYAVPPLRRPVFIGWSHLTFPIGWLLTHAILVLIFFLLLTPLGIIMRLVGRDPMTRRFDPEATTYWVKRDPAPESRRYFRQF